MQDNEEIKKIWSDLAGQQLSGVWFVMDYLQLQFNSDILTCNFWPILMINSETLNIENPTYRNRLCDFITIIVKKISLNEKDGLKIIFENNWEIFVPVKNETGKNIPEAMFLKMSDGRWDYVNSQ